MKKRTISFLISDFRDDGFEQSLKHAGRRHDLVALRVTDPIDRELPNVGWLPLQDPETGENLFGVVGVLMILGWTILGILGSYAVAWFGIRMNTLANSRMAFASLERKPIKLLNILAL